jgi:hypothetical protein
VSTITCAHNSNKRIQADYAGSERPGGRSLLEELLGGKDSSTEKVRMRLQVETVDSIESGELQYCRTGPKSPFGIAILQELMASLEITARLHPVDQTNSRRKLHRTS